ncbi:MAG TPA: UDP-3-O-(3-hydroxymyristoyl)glucosamine N-acyltransferase [Nitrospirae bacterium]|nr:UDP-3-O-(3-hydroxymyristoyl)glucosamine N-acyltransferase [Nitrospirota bacterium]
MLLKDIATHIKGMLYGDGNIFINGISEFDKASAGDIVYIASDKVPDVIEFKGSAILTHKRLGDVFSKIPQIVSKNHKSAFAELLNLFYKKSHCITGISKWASIANSANLSEGICISDYVVVSENAFIGKNVIIYPGVFIGKGVKIGDNCVIYSNVAIMDNCLIGNNVILHPCAVIGADGFGYVFDNGVHKKIPQVGNVIIEDDVEIGANTTIDRAALGSTIIGKGTKIDNLVQIGHNVKIGKNVIIVAQTGIGGSSIIGDGVVLAGQTGISDHAEIESGSVICARSGVTGKLSKNIYLGMPAKPFKKTIKAYEMLHTLPELKERIEQLEKSLHELKKE